MLTLELAPLPPTVRGGTLSAVSGPRVEIDTYPVSRESRRFERKLRRRSRRALWIAALRANPRHPVRMRSALAVASVKHRQEIERAMWFGPPTA